MNDITNENTRRMTGKEALKAGGILLASGASGYWVYQDKCQQAEEDVQAVQSKIANLQMKSAEGKPIPADTVFNKEQGIQKIIHTTIDYKQNLAYHRKLLAVQENSRDIAPYAGIFQGVLLGLVMAGTLGRALLPHTFSQRKQQPTPVT